ncbi:hypothetical protein [Flindersiella endophytica]
MGILLVLASMAFGARIIANADKSTEVWVAKEDIPENTVIDPQKMLAQTKIRFTSDDDAKLYLSARSPFPKGVRAVRTVAKGELVPAKSLTKEPDNSLIDLAIPVAGQGLTFDAGKGDRVDIWAVPKEDELKPRDPNAKAIEVVQDVQLMSLPKSGGIGGGGGGAATVRFSLEDHPDVARMVLLAIVCDISIVEHVAPKTVGGN